MVEPWSSMHKTLGSVPSDQVSRQQPKVLRVKNKSYTLVLKGQ